MGVGMRGSRDLHCARHLCKPPLDKRKGLYETDQESFGSGPLLRLIRRSQDEVLYFATSGDSEETNKDKYGSGHPKKGISSRFTTPRDICSSIKVRRCMNGIEFLL